MHMYNEYSDFQKKCVRYGGLLFFGGAIIAVFGLAYSYIVESKTKFHAEYASQVVVIGEGTVSAKPDIALLNAAIVTEKSTVSEAQEKNTESYNAVARFLGNSGVEAKDIKTINYSIHPQYFYPSNRKPEITGYQVRNALEIKIRDLSKVDEILGGIVESGANEIGNVSFTIEDPAVLKEQARKLAIEMARKKAAALAKDLGVRFSRLVGFSENEGGGTPPPIFYAEAAYGKGGSGGGPTLSEGEQEIKVFVTLTYEFTERR